MIQAIMQDIVHKLVSIYKLCNYVTLTGRRICTNYIYLSKMKILQFGIKIPKVLQ